QEHYRERQLVLAEQADLLFGPILVKLKILACKRSHRLPGLFCEHLGIHHYQINIELEYSFGLQRRFRLAPGGGDQPQQNGNKECAAGHGSLSSLPDKCTAKHRRIYIFAAFSGATGTITSSGSSGITIQHTI